MIRFFVGWFKFCEGLGWGGGEGREFKGRMVLS